MRTDTIGRIDRETAQEFLPVFSEKGMFCNTNNLENKKDILEKARKERNVQELTKDEEREILSSIGLYTNDSGYIIKDFGDYAVGLSKPNFVNKVNAYKLTHQIATIILLEVYRQYKYDDLYISKERIFEYLGYSASDKYKYEEIKNSILSLKNMDYVFYKFRNKTKGIPGAVMTGTFIYNILIDNKGFTLGINKHFVGCVLNSKDFDRGYIKYPYAYLLASKNHSSAGYYLGTFLIREKGNPKLKTEREKVIAYTGANLVKEANINYSSDSRAYKALIAAIEENKALIKKTEPAIDKLRTMKPKKGLKQVIRFFIPKDIESTVLVPKT